VQKKEHHGKLTRSSKNAINGNNPLDRLDKLMSDLRSSPGLKQVVIRPEDINIEIGSGSKGGGDPVSRRKPIVGTKAPPKWVSTGRQTALKDGSNRTVYRNSKTGERATKRMTERNGKRTAKYVQLAGLVESMSNVDLWALKKDTDKGVSPVSNRDRSRKTQRI